MIILYNNITRIIPRPKEQCHAWSYIVQPKRVKSKSYLFGLYVTYKDVPGEFEVYERDWAGGHKKVDNQLDFWEFNYSSRMRIYLDSNGKLYYRPHCEIHTADSETTKVWFKSVKELNGYVSDIKYTTKDLDLSKFDFSES